MAAKRNKSTRTNKTIKSSKSTKLSKPVKSVKKTTAKLSGEPKANETFYQQSPLQPTSKSNFPRRSIISTVVIVVVIIGLLYYFRSSFIVATVNGQPISRMSFNQELEKEAGKRSLDALVTKELILQEANKKNISVSSQEINSELTNITNTLKKQGQSLNQALSTRGITQADLKEQIKIEKLIEKLLASQISVSDKEVSDYVDKFNVAATASADTTNPEGSPATVAAAQTITKTQAKQQLIQQKLTDKLQPYIQQLQSKAKVSYFVNF